MTVLKNVIGVIPGKNTGSPAKASCSARTTTIWDSGVSIGRAEDRGKIHPGADDNASGVAVLLELARVMKDRAGPGPQHRVRRIYRRGRGQTRIGLLCEERKDRIRPRKCIGMVNLDTVGRLGKKKLLVLGGSSAREWVHIFRGAGFVTGVEIEMVSEDLDSSDQKSFQEAGVPAVQLFSGPHLDYHRPTDTVDKIDRPGLVKIASVAKEVIEYLAGRPEPLTSTLNPGACKPPVPKTERKVTLGTVPDFAYKGKGVRLAGVVRWFSCR